MLGIFNIGSAEMIGVFGRGRVWQGEVVGENGLIYGVNLGGSRPLWSDASRGMRNLPP
jgi:hypothetical protein